MAIDPASAGPAIRTMLERWAALRAVRTLLGFAAVPTFLLASLR
jgi:hypothetical protein